MAKPKAQEALEKLNKKYGLQGTTKPATTKTATKSVVGKIANTKAGKGVSTTKNTDKGTTTSKNTDKGKQKITSAPQTRATQKTETKTQSAIDRLNQKYGITGNVGKTTVSSGKTNSYETATQSEYRRAKTTATSKTTIKSEMSEKDRKKRIEEIRYELNQLSKVQSGLSRGSRYVNLDKQIEENATKMSQLREELKNLERVGTFTASELKQQEIDDKKAEALRLQNEINAYGARPSASVAKEYGAKMAQKAEVNAEIDSLKREKTLYDDITKFSNVVNEDEFIGQFKANYRSQDLSREADKAMSRYLDNPTEENKRIAYAYDALAKAYMQNNREALDDKNVDWGWLSKSAAGYLPQLRDQALPELVGYGVGALVGGVVGAPTVGGSIGSGIATGIQSYSVIRGSVYRALLAEGVDEETAKSAASDEALISSLIEGGETAVSWLMAGGGKALKAIGNAATKSVAKGSTNVATKVIAKMATNGVNRTAKKAASAVSRPLWETALRTTAGIGLQGGSEYLEEATQQAVSIANQERAKQGNADSSLISGAGRVIGDAITGKNKEYGKQMHEAGTEGFKIGVMFGGSRTAVNSIVTHYANAKSVEEQNDILDTIINDEESLDALIEEGKASGEGTVSEKIAVEVENAREKGEVTRNQVKKLIAANEVYIKNEDQNTSESNTAEQTEIAETKNSVESTPKHIMLEEQSKANEPLAVEDVKEATGFGDKGAQLVADLANKDGMTYGKVLDSVKDYYLIGFTQPETDGKTLKFDLDEQIEAFTAGKQDNLAQSIAQEERAKSATIHKGVFTENEYSEKLSEAERKMFSTLAKDFKMDIKAVDRIIANYATGAEANARHTDGKMRISSTADIPLVSLGIHEAGHRMAQFNTDAWNTLMYALYENAEQLERRADIGAKGGLMFDAVKDEHDNAGISMNTRDYIEEIAVRNLEPIFVSPEAYNEWRAKLEIDPQLKSAWQKFVEWLSKVIEDISRRISQIKMTKEERAEANKALADTKKFLSLYEDAYRDTMKAAENRANERTKENADNKKIKVASTEASQIDALKVVKTTLNDTERISQNPKSVKSEFSPKKKSDTEINKSEQENDFENIASEEKANFSLKNKNLTINSRIPFTVIKNYIKVKKNDAVALGDLEAEVENLQKGTYQNDATGYSADINSDTINKAIYPTHKAFNVYSSRHIRNLNAMVKLPELFKNAVYVDSRPPQKAKNMSVKEYHHFVAPLFMNNGEYRALITARVRANSDTLYVLKVEVLPIQKRHTLLATQQNAGGSQWVSVPSDISIPELVKDVKIKNYDTGIEDTYSGKDIKFSLKDSKGKSLTKGQQEYFKDTKVRDENGNLLVMYQGSAEDFTVFDRKKSKYSNLYGRGFYFTRSEEHAKQYGNAKAYYLNIKHPVSTTETTITKEQLRKFLEAVAENEDYGFENYGYGATIDSVLSSVYGKSDFLMLYDINQTAIGDLVEATELFNEINGTDFDGFILDTETVTFNSEQAKLTSNEAPTNNPDIRFSLKKPVEETKNLIAVHNISAENLSKSFKLGGLPMPSIAIVKASEGFNQFAEISIVFDKSTIDPELSKRNMVFGSDAWTPTFPRVEYKVNEKAVDEIQEKINNLVSKKIQDDLGGTHLESYNVEDALNRVGDMVKHYRYNHAMKYAFLADSGTEFELPMRQKPLSRTGRLKDEVIVKVAEALSEDDLRKMWHDGNDARAEFEPQILNALREYLQEKYNDEKIVQALMPKEELSLGDFLDYAEDALKYKRNGIQQEVDYREARNLIDEKVDMAEYETWLKDLFSDVIAKEGIRNNKDLFTPSGNRRSFEALHYELNLENVVKRMIEEGTQGIGGWGNGNIIGGSAIKFNSIDELKNNANNRLQTLPQSEYENIRKGLQDRFWEITHSLDANSFSAAADLLVEAVVKYKTKSGMANYLRKESEGWARYSDYIVYDLIELVNDIRNMPVDYFEAKPQRAVGFDEIKAVIMPTQESYEDDLSEVKAELEKLNIPVFEYEYGDNNARIKALNSLEDARFSLKRTNDISTKDRKELLDTIEHLKHEFEVTKFAKADQKKLAKMTRELLKEYDSKADTDETFNAIDKLYQYMANGEGENPAAWNEVYSRAYGIAENIVKTALVVDDYMYREYESLRKYLRTTGVKFNPIFDSVPTYYENYNDFRKKNMGRIKFTKDGMSIDSMYQELSTLYPEFFNAEEQTDSADMLERIVDVLDEISPTEVNPYSREIGQTASYLANDIINRFFDIPQAKPTFADKAERRVVDARIAGNKKVEAVRQRKDERIQKLIEKQREKTKKLIEKAKASKTQAIEKEKAKRKDSLAKMNETQKAKTMRARILRHCSELNKKLINPTDNQHIPFELQGAVATLLESINLESNYTFDVESGSYKKNDEGLPTKRTKAFEALRKVYNEIKSSVVVDPELLGENGMLSDVILLADKRIADMTSAELETIWQAIRAIEASVYTANRMFSASKFETILETAETLRADNKGAKEKSSYKGFLGKAQNLVSLDMLTPETYLHYLGDAGDSIFRMMRDAQDKHISIMKEVADFTHKTLKGVNVNSLETTIHTVKLGGENVKLSTAQLMELYVLMKREQAVDHILVGGILPDDIKTKGIKDITKAEPVRNVSVHEITQALSKLKNDERAIADKLQKFVSDVLSAHGNKASMQVYNYEKFNEKNYWTIRTNKQEIASDTEKDTAVTTVANKGMTKGTKPHANTSVRIGSIFDTFASHSSDMATYAAWLGTTEDINRIRNFVFWEDGVRTGTVKGILDTVHGKQGSHYLEKLLTDIAIGVKGTDTLNPFDKLIGNYKAASVGANIRVIIQQPTAILRALDMINPVYLAEGAVRPLKGWEKAKKYAPIAQWKDWGYFDINTGRQMKDVLFDNASILEKTKQAGMWGASMMDSLAWGQLWNAVEAETKSKHKELEVGSEKYYETVAKRFTEIVDHTQVVDGIVQRSQIMRESGALTKMATSFMGEPTKQYNMAISAMHDLNTGKGKRKKAVARLGRTAVTLAISGIVNACAQSFVDALRDDDKEKDYWEKWLAAFIGDGEETKFINSNLGNTINPFGYVPFAKDILSILQGYDVKRMDVESITKTYNATANMFKAITGTGKYTIKEASAALFAEIGRLFGVPVANVKRDIKSVVTSFATATDNYLLQYRIEKYMLNINYAGNNNNYIDILFNAYNNDKEAYELIYNDMLKSGFDVEKIQSGMETRMKEAEGVKEASDLSKRYMTPKDEKQYDNSLKKIKSSKVWKSANETQRKGAEADLYEFITSTSDDMQKSRTEARLYGIDETEYTLWKLAIEMADQPKGEKGSGSYDYKEKAEAINSLNLGDEEIAYFFGNGLSESSKEELNNTLNAGIDIKEYVNFKAATSDMKADKDANGKSITNSKKRKIVNYLNSANLTREEWEYFYYEIMNYKK